MINYIKGKNFLSYPDINYVFPSSGLIHITGKILDGNWSNSNGAGKTAILAFIKWVLFGVNDYGNVDAIINSQSKRNCYGELSCRNIYNQEMIVKRYRKHKEHRNNVYLIVDGINVKSDDIQQQIEENLGFDLETFLRGFVFDRNSSLANIKDKEAKNFFEKLLGKDFTEWHIKTKNYQEDCQQQYDKVSVIANREEAALIRTKELLTEAVKEWEIWKQQRDNKKQKLTNDLIHANKELEELQTEYRNLSAKWVEIEGTQKDAFLELNKHRQKLNDSEYTIRSTIRHLEASLSERICPTCKRPFPKKINEEEIKLELTLKQEELIRISTQLLSINPKIEEYRNYELWLNKEIRTFEGIIKNTELNIQSIKNELKQLEEDLHAQQIKRLQDSINNSEKILESTTETKKQWEEYLANIEIVLAMFSKTGLQSYMLDFIIPYINAQLSYYLQSLTNGEIEAQFKMTTEKGKEKFHLEAHKIKGGKTYESLSEGQKARLDLCLILSLYDRIKRIIPTQILIFDEIFDKIDEAGIQSVISMLQEVSKNTLVLIISHNDNINAYADRCINVVMEDHKSKIEI